jgi:uncharacterized protein with PQ loop repeat
MTNTLAQGIGYLASVLLGISLIVNSDLRFRWFSLFGCISFVVYGLMINALPVMLTNSVLLLINLFQLIKIYRTEEDFDLLSFNPGDEIIKKFMKFHEKDLRSYFPYFQLEGTENDFRFMVLRDMAIANIFVATVQPNGDALVKINYTTARYRDYKVGSYIFDKEKRYLIAHGVKRLVYHKIYNKEHRHFLKVMRFHQQQVNGKEIYTREL